MSYNEFEYTKSFDGWVIENFTPVDVEEQFCEELDEAGDIYIGSLCYAPSDVLRNVDPVAYRCGVADMSGRSDMIEIDGEPYNRDEIEDSFNDLEEKVNSILDDIFEAMKDNGEPTDLDVNAFNQLTANASQWVFDNDEEYDLTGDIGYSYWSSLIN